MELNQEKNTDSYSGSYDAEVKQSYEKLKNRPAFKYEASADPAYRAYRDSYRREGQAAMKSSMAEAADLTGGYGSSYAQRVGQQQYGEYLRKLSDVMPELYSQAYQRYKDEGDELRGNLSAASKLADSEYGRYKDRYQRADELDKFAYSKQQDAYKNLMELIATTGYVPTDEELERAGMSPEQAYALSYEFLRQNRLLPSDKKNSSSMPGYAVIGREKQKLGSNNGGSGSGESKSKPKGEKQIGKAFL